MVASALAMLNAVLAIAISPATHAHLTAVLLRAQDHMMMAALVLQTRTASQIPVLLASAHLTAPHRLLDNCLTLASVLRTLSVLLGTA